MDLLVLCLAFLGLVLLDMLAVPRGAESRDDFAWPIGSGLAILQ